MIAPHPSPRFRVVKFPRLAPLLIAVGLYSASIPLVQAATVLQYGHSSEYVSDNINFERTATMTGTGPYVSEVGFDSSAPLSPASGYTGPVFYGGYRFSSDSHPVGFDRQGVFSNYSKTDGTDTLYFNVVGSNNESFHGTTMQFASLFVFKQTAFEAPFQSGGVSIDGFSISLYKHANGASGTQFRPQLRWLVETGGIYYLSSQTFTHTVNDTVATFVLSGQELEETLWAVYDPTADISFDASSATFQSLSLEGITSVGFYLDEDSFMATTGTVGMRLGVSSFTVTSAIPEPGMVAFVAIGVPFFLRGLLRR